MDNLQDARQHVDDLTADGKGAALLHDLRAPVIQNPFDLKTVFALVVDIIAR